MSTNHALECFLKGIKGQIPPTQIKTDEFSREAYSSDASCYKLVPQVVVFVESDDEVEVILATAHTAGLGVTFRAAGTSLSGQGVSDQILVILGAGWDHLDVLDQGMAIRLGPGVVGEVANRRLAGLHRKIGPDPSSIGTAKIGGIVANNSSGMCCGVSNNAFHTLKSMKLILANGSKLDTACPDSRKAFSQTNATMLAELAQMTQEVRADSELTELIRKKYRIKNTMGQSLNALVEYQDPIEVLQHLLVGSEGTLGFISEVVLSTVPDPVFKALGFYIFPNIDDAVGIIEQLADLDISAIELMDRPCLRSVENRYPEAQVSAEYTDDCIALLIETAAESDIELQQACAKARLSLSGFEAVVDFTEDAQIQARLWAMRKGLLPAVGASRPSGTTIIIEDIAVPVPQLAQTCKDVRQLFNRLGYEDAMIFGHAKDGNLHVTFPQGFSEEAEIHAYEALMDGLAENICTHHGGSLKAEHGTGRNMAPYVEMEWGPKAYGMMKRIKALLDPKGILNPGVILNEDPKVHIKDVKRLPVTGTKLDDCIECGFCEPACPSRSLTLTPRQRIVVSRKRHTMEHEQGINPAQVNTFEKAFDYQFDKTCAGCGICATRCPVGINTGDLVRAKRGKEASNYIPGLISRNFGALAKGTRLSLKMLDILGGIIGRKTLPASLDWIRKKTGLPLPKLHASMSASSRIPTVEDKTLIQSTLKDGVVYFPSCVARVAGASKNSETQGSLYEVTMRLLQRGRFKVVHPENLDSLCCGMPFKSKGSMAVAANKGRELLSALWEASEHGRYPVYLDTSPCAMTIIELKDTFPDFEKLEILDSVAFISEKLLDRLEIQPIDETVALHVTCSATSMGLGEQMRQIAQRCAEEVIVPEGIACCGFAGDKGFLTPELNAAALQPLKPQIPDHCQSGFSNSKTCELGLSTHSGIDYQGIAYLVDRASSD